jgi:hypothetical protein
MQKLLAKSPHKTDTLINMDIPDDRHSRSKEWAHPTNKYFPLAPQIELAWFEFIANHDTRSL